MAAASDFTRAEVHLHNARLALEGAARALAHAAAECPQIGFDRGSFNGGDTPDLSSVAKFAQTVVETANTVLRHKHTTEQLRKGL